MVYPNALIPLVAEPIHRGRNDRECHRGHFCCAKAGVSRRKSVMPLRLLPNYRDLPMFCSPDTDCGHNDFCSVRLNDPIWWFILTHQYRLSLSQFTESVLIDSVSGPLLLRKSRSLPTQKCYAPLAVDESSRLIGITNLRQFWYLRKK